MAQALNMAPFAVDMALDSVVDAIVVRAEQIGSGAIDNDRKVHIYNLQRKVKSLKEQLECKVWKLSFSFKIPNSIKSQDYLLFKV